jgi:hypothetical protein
VACGLRRCAHRPPAQHGDGSGRSKQHQRLALAQISQARHELARVLFTGAPGELLAEVRHLAQRLVHDARPTALGLLGRSAQRVR